jgi:hypothetical protein
VADVQREAEAGDRVAIKRLRRLRDEQAMH